MKYIGIQTQQRRNNLRSTLMLLLFPCVILVLTWLFFWIADRFVHQDAYPVEGDVLSGRATWMFLQAAPWVVGGCLIWFLVAWFLNTTLIRRSTGSRPLERRENKRVYNLVENLCMANQLHMPKINVIEDDSLNAFASGIHSKSYTVTLSRGLIDRLDDAELEAVIAHELTHIRNHDVNVLIVSIVFVGIFSFLTQAIFRVLISVRVKNNNKNGSGVIIILLLILLLAAIGYLVTTLMRFAISRNREYMADAGSAEMTRNPQALASALRKIAVAPRIEAVTQTDVAQLFIDNPMRKTSLFNQLFATHPPMAKRIRMLEQF